MHIDRQDIKRLRKPKVEVQSWTIYLWREGDKYLGASPIITKDGVKDVYCAGWEIEVDPESKRNEDKHRAWRAKTRVKNLLNDTLNVINWYGKKVLNSKGEVDVLKLQQQEANSAFQAVKNDVDINDLYKIRKFPVKEITSKQAREYNFRG